MALLTVASLFAPASESHAQARSISRGTAKISSRLFNPFDVLRPSRLQADPFGLPTGLASFQFAAPGLFDPYSPTASTKASEAEASTPASITIAPVAGSQTAPTTISESSSTVSSFRRPIRSPYRPPPRGPFGP